MPRSRWRTLEQVQAPLPRPLLPLAARRLAVVLLAVCAAVTGLLGAWFSDQTRAGWLDRGVDARLHASLGGHRQTLNLLAGLGDPVSVAVMVTALIIVCIALRRWRGAVLAAVAIPAAGAITELVLKPFIHRTMQGALSLPSGHATAMFALATTLTVLLVDPVRPRMPVVLRVLLAVAALAVAGAVAIAMVGLGLHYFTDAVAGAAVGTGVVMATALILDLPGWSWRDHSGPEPVPEARRPASQRP